YASIASVFEAGAQEVRTQDGDAAAIDGQDAAIAEGAELLIDALARGADHRRQLLLGELDSELDAVRHLAAMRFGERKELLGQPVGHVEKGSVLHQLIGIAQTLGEHLEESNGDLRRLANEAAKVVLAQG